MKDQLTATIIPFPVRNRPVPVEAVEAERVDPGETTVAPQPNRRPTSELSQSSQRLTQALASLSTALADQKDATQRWKAAIEDLAAKMRSLGEVGIAQKKIS